MTTEEDAKEFRSREIRLQIEGLLGELRDECDWHVMDIEDWVAGVIEGMYEEADEQG